MKSTVSGIGKPGRRSRNKRLRQWKLQEWRIWCQCRLHCQWVARILRFVQRFASCAPSARPQGCNTILLPAATTLLSATRGLFNLSMTLNFKLCRVTVLNLSVGVLNPSSQRQMQSRVGSSKEIRRNDWRLWKNRAKRPAGFPVSTVTSAEEVVPCMLMDLVPCVLMDSPTRIWSRSQKS